MTAFSYKFNILPLRVMSVSCIQAICSTKEGKLEEIMTRNQRRIVMISSTARDLPEHREELRLGCQRAGFEVRMMEHLPALDADAVKGSLDLVDEADIYVGVFAYRYGYVPEGYDISITEMEYNRAVEQKKPRL